MAVRSIPHLSRTETAAQLLVHGRPFLVRGAELHNSSFTSLEHMETVWPKMVGMNVNTVLGCICWDMIEPREGEFNFDLLDGLLLKARAHGLKLILLWFATWKNGISTYIPSWVKLSPSRFPRATIRTPKGSRTTEIISPIHGETADADAAAFRALMRHLKAVDAEDNTVIMVQVENEVGLLGDSRDYSSVATDVLSSPVPADLLEFLRRDWANLHPGLRTRLEDVTDNGETLIKGGSWAKVFDDSVYTDELFMAYHYACYVNKVASAGKEEYPIPLYANFWQNYGEDAMAKEYPVLAGGGDLPGDYPSGGAVSNVLDIWMHYAPALDFLAPDTYLNDYHRICRSYRHKGQPLFIPEQRRDEYGARRIWTAIGHYLALGACPFALDSLEVDDSAFTSHYRLLSEMSDYILAAQQNPDTIFGFFFDEPGHKEAPDRPDPVVVMGGYRLNIERSFSTGPQGAGYGMVIYLGPGSNDDTARFLLIGAGFQVRFAAVDKHAQYTGILSFEEKTRDETVPSLLRTRRTLNGDETRSGQQAIMPSEAPDDGGFPICITIPALTRIAEVTVYSLAA